MASPTTEEPLDTPKETLEHKAKEKLEQRLQKTLEQFQSITDEYAKAKKNNGKKIKKNKQTFIENINNSLSTYQSRKSVLFTKTNTNSLSPSDKENRYTEIKNLHTDIKTQLSSLLDEGYKTFGKTFGPTQLKLTGLKKIKKREKGLFYFPGSDLWLNIENANKEIDKLSPVNYYLKKIEELIKNIYPASLIIKNVNKAFMLCNNEEEKHNIIKEAMLTLESLVNNIRFGKDIYFLTDYINILQLINYLKSKANDLKLKPLIDKIKLEAITDKLDRFELQLEKNRSENQLVEDYITSLEVDLQHDCTNKELLSLYNIELLEKPYRNSGTGVQSSTQPTELENKIKTQMTASDNDLNSFTTVLITKIYELLGNIKRNLSNFRAPSLWFEKAADSLKEKAILLVRNRLAIDSDCKKIHARYYERAADNEAYKIYSYLQKGNWKMAKHIFDKLVLDDDSYLAHPFIIENFKKIVNNYLTPAGERINLSQKFVDCIEKDFKGRKLEYDNNTIEKLGKFKIDFNNLIMKNNPYYSSFLQKRLGNNHYDIYDSQKAFDDFLHSDFFQSKTEISNSNLLGDNNNTPSLTTRSLSR